MISAFSIILTVLLIVAGYLYLVKYYFSNTEIKITKESILAMDTTRITYIIVAILTGLGINLTFMFIYSGSTFLTRLKIISLIMILLPVAAVDLRDHIIPNRLLIGGLALRLIFYIAEITTEGFRIIEILKSDLIGALVISGFFLICMFVTRNGIGAGDVKLLGLMGLYQGLWGVMVSVFTSLIVSFVISVVLLIARKKGRKDSIAFGPSIFIGTFLGIILNGV
ncbi:prepilin peptidase [Acetivibrio clariflavus]|uniref:Flp pilus assembly protein, protease CpaA n=1 Tax=Acetivibrio clariflavus (strain DSM 19732 / NBRC 101661 / EBR45) TaxID=720554 RepID=G8LS99_ACECE|nr:prepilin peptidase [Acetivibrio clariflavus]AEV67160.1 Flp pilus assembly protein, protease CpaA [Acetivibrio clariflavus DSM 19732]